HFSGAKTSYGRGAGNRALQREPALFAVFLGLFDLDEFLAFSEFFDDAVDRLLTTFEDGICHTAGVQSNGLGGVIVTRDDEIDAVGGMVGINHGHNWNTQGAGFSHSNLMVANVDDKQGVRQSVHILDAADRLVQLVEFALEHQAFFLAHALGRAFSLLRFHFLQTLDGSLDRLEVGHHAAQPTAVDIGHTAALRFFCNQFTCSALGADEQNFAAASSQLTQVLLRFQVLDNALLEVDNVDLVSLTEDVRSHLRVPVTGLVTEVDSGFQHFTHQRHNILQGLGLIPGASHPEAAGHLWTPRRTCAQQSAEHTTRSARQIPQTFSCVVIGRPGLCRHAIS